MIDAYEVGCRAARRPRVYVACLHVACGHGAAPLLRSEELFLKSAEDAFRQGLLRFANMVSHTAWYPIRHGNPTEDALPRSAEVRPVSEDTPQLATASLHARSALCSCAKVAHVQPRAPVATGAPILEQSASSSNPAHPSPTTNLDTRMLAMRVRAHGPPEALRMELVDVPRPGPHQLLVCPSAIRTPHAHARTARSVRSQQTRAVLADPAACACSHRRGPPRYLRP